MQTIFPQSFFVTGTDTDVGKTVVSAILTAGLNATYWKPIQSGPPSDTETVRKATGLPLSNFIPERYLLSQPLSPHLAAKIDGISINISDFQLPSVKSTLIVEGAGGLMVPINKKHLVVDLIKHLNLSVVLVCHSKLGTINHTLLSLEKLRRSHIDVLGIVMNGPPNKDNKEAVEYYGQTPVIAEVDVINNFDRETLLSVFNTCFKRELCLTV